MIIVIALLAGLAFYGMGAFYISLRNRADVVLRSDTRLKARDNGGHYLGSDRSGYTAIGDE